MKEKRKNTKKPYMAIITQNEENNFYLFNRTSQQAALELTM